MRAAVSRRIARRSGVNRSSGSSSSRAAGRPKGQTRSSVRSVKPGGGVKRSAWSWRCARVAPMAKTVRGDGLPELAPAVDPTEERAVARFRDTRCFDRRDELALARRHGFGDDQVGLAAERVEPGQLREDVGTGAVARPVDAEDVSRAVRDVDAKDGVEVGRKRPDRRHVEVVARKGIHRDPTETRRLSGGAKLGEFLHFRLCRGLVRTVPQAAGVAAGADQVFDEVPTSAARPLSPRPIRGWPSRVPVCRGRRRPASRTRRARAPALPA